MVFFTKHIDNINIDRTYDINSWDIFVTSCILINMKGKPWQNLGNISSKDKARLSVKTVDTLNNLVYVMSL